MITCAQQFFLWSKRKRLQGVVAHTFNPCTREAEASGWVSGQAGVTQWDPVSKRNKTPPPQKKTHILTYTHTHILTHTHTHKIGLGSVSLREGNGWHLYGLRWPLSAPSELSLQFWQLPSPKKMCLLTQVLTTTLRKVKLIPVTFLCENTKSD